LYLQNPLPADFVVYILFRGGPHIFENSN
jgi:hypothetical protein